MEFLREFFQVVVLSVPGMLVLGLILGSLLNVVVYRSPRIAVRAEWEQATGLMLDPAAWGQAFDRRPPPKALAECAGQLADALETTPAVSLWSPGSACPKCGHMIRAHENVPVLSWLWLRAKCSACGTRISARYPTVELAVGLLFAWVAWVYGPSAQALPLALFCAGLLGLALIDLDTHLLPDSLTLGLLWLGLVAAALGWNGSAPMAILGAAAGYAAFWAMDAIVRFLLHTPAFAAGDWKLAAAIGAWLQHPLLLGCAVVIAILSGCVGVLLRRRSSEDAAMPFGPYLALGAGAVALFGTHRTLALLQ